MLRGECCFRHTLAYLPFIDKSSVQPYLLEKPESYDRPHIDVSVDKLCVIFVSASHLVKEVGGLPVRISTGSKGEAFVRPFVESRDFKLHEVYLHQDFA